MNRVFVVLDALLILALIGITIIGGFTLITLILALSMYANGLLTGLSK